MRYNLATLLTITTVGPPVMAYLCGEWVLPPEFGWIAYSLLPPLVAAAILGIWARVLFWSIAHIDELKDMRAFRR